jgi:3-dehydroquinate synthase
LPQCRGGLKTFMQTVRVDLGLRSYSIQMGEGLFSQSIRELNLKGGVALITDKTVAAQSWFGSLRHELAAQTSLFECMEVEAGEGSKSLEVFAQLCSQMALKRFTRSSTVIAVGGGVVGDLAGYLASSYLRGVSFVQIPTTLLAAVDSSVGGKTGVNLPEGKNLVGAFYQPSAVIIDLHFLKTLPEREWSAGMAEVIKYGLIRDAALFAEVAGGRPTDLARMIQRCLEIKAEVVAGDEREETGLRAVLNFGHTLGHALEQSVGYGKLLHGEAVAIGMVAAAKISTRVCGLSEKVVEKIQQALVANQLPTRFPGLTYEQLESAMLRDKKVSAAGLSWVLLKEVGKTEMRKDVSPEQIREAVSFVS